MRKHKFSFRQREFYSFFSAGLSQKPAKSKFFCRAGGVYRTLSERVYHSVHWGRMNDGKKVKSGSNNREHSERKVSPVESFQRVKNVIKSKKEELKKKKKKDKRRRRRRRKRWKSRR